MLNFYRLYATTYHNKTKVGKNFCGIRLIEDEEAKNYIDIITWNNLEEKYFKQGCHYYFNYWNFKKGRVISFFDITLLDILKQKDLRNIAEWKQKDLNIEIEYTFKKETSISINDVLKWHDIKKATQYLNEKGSNF